MNAAAPTERRRIRRLSAETVERIAAGEVVERPASVVKELVENALDAGAASVVVRLAGGGLDRLEVSDDGDGIPAAELELAVEPHATSKLPPAGPIEEIATLGFRGEALAAIGAVARLRLLSRPPDAELAEGIAVAGGSPAGRFAGPRAPGTTVTVEELFYNTPARRKFLRSAAREQVEVVRTLERLYLARPSVSYRLVTEGGTIAELPAATSLADAAARVLGAGFAEGAFPVAGELPGGRVVGTLGAPSRPAATSTELYLAVNGRPIVSRPLALAVRAAYGDTMPRPRFPTGVLHLEIARDRLDVNVHPTKREVRLSGGRDVEDGLRRVVREALVAADRPAPLRGSAAVSPRAGDARASGRPAEANVPRPASAVLPRQRTLEPPARAGAPAVVAAAAGRPRLELLGSLDALYWIAASDDGLVVVDQHAASERLLFETLLGGGRLARQSLVEPVILRLTAGDRAALAAHAAEVGASGFAVEEFGPGSHRLTAVPSYRGRRAPAEGLVELLRELAGGGRPTLPDGLVARRAASIACHAALRAGDVVERTTIADLLGALDRLPDRPRSCPHGRPIMVSLPRARLDRWFLRSPG